MSATIIMRQRLRGILKARGEDVSEISLGGNARPPKALGMNAMSLERTSPENDGTLCEPNETAGGLERVGRWIYRFIFSLGVLESLGIAKGLSLQNLKPHLFSFLFEVTDETVPWGLFLIGELVKKLNAWTRRSDGTINRKLADLIEFKVPASEKPQNGVSCKDVVIDQETNVWVRIYTPRQESVKQNSRDECNTESKLLPVLVYYHGGGFGVVCADQIDVHNWCRTLARNCNIIIVSVNYRRAPEHRYPTAYQDSFKVLEWLQSDHSNVHLPPMADISQCFVGGESAGGNIAHFMACQAAEAEKELLPLKIRGVILLQPFFGSKKRTPAEVTLTNVPIISTDATDWHWKAFLPEEADRDHPASNVFGPKARDISQLPLPPVFLVMGTLDLLIDHHVNYATRMRKMGKSIKVKNYIGGMHGFYFLMPVGVKIALACLADIKEFLQSCSHGNRHPEHENALNKD